MNFGEPHGAELTGMEDVAAERVGVPWRSSRIIRNGVGDPRRLHLDHVSAHAAMSAAMRGCPIRYRR